MAFQNIPPAQRSKYCETELRKQFPTAVGLTANVGLFVVEVRFNHSSAWAELRHAKGGVIVEDFRSFSLEAGLHVCKTRIERICRETLTMILVDPDSVEVPA